LQDVYKSGFIFIEDTFYNDHRDPANLDYSHVIREWAASHKLGPFQTALMENTKFEDLTVRLGYPYVYQHQGSCEHLIVFSDVR
jgi:snRNA-activating protein complex subunit 3